MELFHVFKTQIEDDQDFFEELVDEGLNDFQRSGKRNFSYLENILPVQLGARRLNVPWIGIRKGIMSITG